MQCSRAVQKRVQKRAGAGEREGTASFPRSGTSDFDLGCFIFAISSLYYLRAWYRLPNKNLSVTVRDRAGTLISDSLMQVFFKKARVLKNPGGEVGRKMLLQCCILLPFHSHVCPL